MRGRLVTAAATVATATLVPAFMLIGANAAWAGNGGGSSNGNSGTVKISKVGGAADESNDPHVGCSFDVQWYGYNRATSEVQFEGQAPTKDLDITVTGPKKVQLGAAASGSTLNTVRTYTLAFKGDEPQPNQGYHVKLTTNTEGNNGSDKKTKVFWVGPCDTTTPTDPTTPTEPTDPTTPTEPTDPTTPTEPTDPTTPTEPTDPTTPTEPTDPTTPTEPTDPTTPTDPTDPTTPTDPTGPFSWDWKYADPTCAGVTVAYPSNIPDGQANDVNIRVQTPGGTKTLNFHNHEGTWSGTHAFNLADHPQWDAGTASYDITWVQVGGTNYHWQGDVACVTDGDPSTTDAPLVETEIDGFRTGSTTVSRGSTVASDTVAVDGADDDLELQVWTTGSDRGTAGRSAGHWSTVKTVSTTDVGTARVTYPRLTKKGTFKFRLAVAGTATSTGDTTGTLTVRVR